MPQDHRPDADVCTCPACGQQLRPEGDLLRCKTDGLFFRYGPRLLVHVARPDDHEATLMPWQTLGEPEPVSV